MCRGTRHSLRLLSVLARHLTSAPHQMGYFPLLFLRALATVLLTVFNLSVLSMLLMALSCNVRAPSLAPKRCRSTSVP